MVVGAIALMVGAVQLLRVLAGDGFFTDTLFFDEAPYGWLNRVEALAAGQGWYDQVVYSVGPPEGHEQHWTRLMDVLLWLGGVALSPVFGFENGLALWANLISPLLMIVTAWLMWRLSTLLMARRDAMVATGLFLLHPMILNTFAWGRADHHALLRLGLVGFFYWFVKMVVSDEKTGRAAILAGLVGGLTLWANVEALGFLLIGLIFAGLWWLRGGDELSWPAAVMSSVLWAVMVVAVAVEQGGAYFEMTPVDTMGWPYVVLFTLNALFWWGLWKASRTPGWSDSAGKRVVLAGGLTALVLGAIAWWVPHFYAGPFAEVDPLYRNVVLDHLSEQSPALRPSTLTPVEMVGRGLVLLGTVVVGAVGIAKQMRETKGVIRWVWGMMGAMAIGFSLLALDTVRWAAYAPLGASLGMAVVVGPLLDWVERLQAKGRSVVVIRPLAIVGILIGIPTLGVAFMVVGDRMKPSENGAKTGVTEPVGACDLREVVPMLHRLEEIDDEALIAVDTDLGSELIYRGGYSVLSIGSHRYQPGFRVFVEAMRAKDMETSHRLLTDRGVQGLLICHDQVWHTLKDGGHTAVERLIAGDDPAPYELLKEPGEADGFWIFYVSSRATDSASAARVDEGPEEE